MSLKAMLEEAKIQRQKAEYQAKDLHKEIKEGKFNKEFIYDAEGYDDLVSEKVKDECKWKFTSKQEIALREARLLEMQLEEEFQKENIVSEAERLENIRLAKLQKEKEDEAKRIMMLEKMMNYQSPN